MQSDLITALGDRTDVVITIDFETYFDKSYSLRKLTTEAYVRDPRFEVLVVGVKFGNQPAVHLEADEFRDWTQQVDWSRVTVVAHNAQFDCFVLSHHFGVRPRFIVCTLSMARAIHDDHNGLEFLGPKYGLGEKGDELKNSIGKRRKDFTPEDFARLAQYCVQDVEITAGLIRPLAAQLPTSELWAVDSTVRMFTEPKFRGDLAVLEKALLEERTKKAELLKRVGVTAEDLRSPEKFATILRKIGVEPPQKNSPKKKDSNGAPAKIYAFAKSDQEMKDLEEHPREDVRILAEARLAITSNIVETRTERLISCAKRGPIPFYLKYCGAHTHRWSGGDKMNPQNFNRGGILRDAILAPPGHVLVVADSGQIEARVVAWVAGQKELLETFRRNDAKTDQFMQHWDRATNGKRLTKEEEKALRSDLAIQGIEEGDFYSDEGSRYFLKKLSKKETPVERQTSKSMVLGLGFGMGEFKFGCETLKGMLGAPPVQFTVKEAMQFNVDVGEYTKRAHSRTTEGVSDYDRIERLPTRLTMPERLVHFAVAAHFVALYREKNPKIVALWDAMRDMIKVMAPAGDPGVLRARFGPLKFGYQKIRKPGGMVLHYPDLQPGKHGYTYLHKRKRTKIYGGLLTENVVQSIARDIVAEQALWIRAAGYALGTTTHDEVVAIVPQSQGEACLAFMLERMRTPPSWCADLPLNATGAIAERYGDAK